ncbi:MAG: hypothetical protein H7A14_04060 [Sinobacteraceae bacterium]|nr:hypothetical protein [Nevskiaceae bacterium]
MAPIFDPSTLAPPAELALPKAAELRALSPRQMSDRCKALARAGRTEREIAAALAWSIEQVRRALSYESFRGA